jgi:hypothetical protein
MGNININGSGTYSTLNSAVAAASATDTINITGTWSSHDTTNVTWDVAVSVRADSDSKVAAVAWNTGDTTYRLRPTSGHVFTVTADVDIHDINVISDSSGTSDELFRNLGGYEVDLRRCHLGFSGNTDQQDIVYTEADSGTNSFSFESCTFFDVGRSVVDAYGCTGGTWTISFNGCTSYNVGANGGRADGCWVGQSASGATWNIKAFHNLMSVDDDFVFGFEEDVTLDSDYNITNISDANYISSFPGSETKNDTGSQFSKTFVEGDPASGQIGLRDITTTPYDLRIYDDATDNLAQDFHSVETGANSGLAIPNDIVGTVRGASEDHDCGAFEIAAVGGDLSVNTSQSINLSESIQGQLSVAGISLFESVTLTEAVTIADLLLDITISLSEQLNLSEFVSTSMNLGAISINETVELAEALTSGVPLEFSKFENITLTEFLSLLETIAPSAFENITITEYLALLKDVGLSEFENITVNELVSASLTSAGADVSESIELSEFVSMLKDIGIDTSQQITITEVVNGIVSLAGISAGEDVTINEAVSGLLALAGIDTSQSINVSEFISGLLSVSGIDVSQDITLTEYLNVLTTSDLPITDAYESITIAESLTLLFNFLPLSEIQNINVSEFVSALLSTTGINVSDTINLSETATLLMSLATISVSDSVTLTEAVTALLETTGASVYDTITINEYIQGILEITGISVSESVTVSEFIIVTMVTVAGIMRVNFSVRRPSVGYSTRKPKITFN